MNALSVIIPSKTDKNLGACVAAVRAASETCRIIVADDFDGPARFLHPDYEPVDWQMGAKPFVFARNINIGIRAAGADDVILLNDDALLATRSGFTAMQRIAKEHPEYGVIASTCRNVGNRRQWPAGGRGLREEPRMVCFVCVLIPRRTIDAVGLLDERFVAYGCDDDDYCLRVRRAGLKIGIFDGCYVDHGSLKSTFRGSSLSAGNYQANLRIFADKWGPGESAQVGRF
jgi:GT2 family glycosyltransferase